MKFVREASELGLRPGEWPTMLNVDQRLWMFSRSVYQTPGGGGDLLANIYVPAPVHIPGKTVAIPKQANGQDELHILND